MKDQGHISKIKNMLIDTNVIVEVKKFSYGGGRIYIIDA